MGRLGVRIVITGTIEPLTQKGAPEMIQLSISLTASQKVLLTAEAMDANNNPVRGPYHFVWNVSDPLLFKLVFPVTTSPSSIGPPYGTESVYAIPLGPSGRARIHVEAAVPIGPVIPPGGGGPAMPPSSVPAKMIYGSIDLQVIGTGTGEQPVAIRITPGQPEAK